MKAAFVALLVLGAVSAMTVEESIDLIAKIDSTAFGHTIFETIYV